MARQNCDTSDTSKALKIVNDLKQKCAKKYGKESALKVKLFPYTHVWWKQFSVLDIERSKRNGWTLLSEFSPKYTSNPDAKHRYKNDGLKERFKNGLLNPSFANPIPPSRRLWRNRCHSKLKDPNGMYAVGNTKHAFAYLRTAYSAYELLDELTRNFSVELLPYYKETGLSRAIDKIIRVLKPDTVRNRVNHETYDAYCASWRRIKKSLLKAN